MTTHSSEDLRVVKYELELGVTGDSSEGNITTRTQVVHEQRQTRVVVFRFAYCIDQTTTQRVQLPKRHLQVY